MYDLVHGMETMFFYIIVCFDINVILICLFVLMLYVPVNNFSVMSG